MSTPQPGTPQPGIPPQIDQLDHSSGTPPQEHKPVHGQKPEKPFREVLKGFLIHFTVYVLVNALLIYLDLRKPEDGYWVQWVIGGWGIGVFFHGLAVFLRWKREKSTPAD